MIADTSAPTLLYVKVEGDPTHYNDGHIASNYLFEINGDVDPVVHGDAAMGLFHSFVSVSKLNDFTFRVFDTTGAELDHTNNPKEQCAYMNSGDLFGPVECLPFEIQAPRL
ncbi:hypothetical protein ACVIGB_000761 [Bradyrhizobium sp. USDA 4341]